MSEAFLKICLHHQALYETNNVTKFTSATKLRTKNYLDMGLLELINDTSFFTL